MPNLNKVMLMGNLTKDPELRFMPQNNTPVVNISIAVNRTWTDRQTSEKRQETTYVEANAFQKTAEVINQYFSRGSPIYIEGRLKLDEWQDKDGNKRQRLKVVVDQFEFIQSKQEAGNQQPAQGRTPPSTLQQAPASQQQQTLGDDDIAF